MFIRHQTVLPALVAALTCAGACTSPPLIPADAAVEPGDAQPDAGPVIDASTSRVVALEIEPAEPQLILQGGESGTLALTAVAVREDGTRTPLEDPTWTLEHPRLGQLSDEGVFNATGAIGGAVRVDTTSRGLLASATLHVFVEWTSVGAELSLDEVEPMFERPMVEDSTRAARVTYPLQDALMPQNVAAPAVQWQGEAPTDHLRVRVARPHVSITAYLQPAGAGYVASFTPSVDAWRSLVESEPGAPIEVRVDRHDADAEEVVTGAPLSFAIDSSAMFGVTYYRDHSPGALQVVVAIRPGDEIRQTVVANLPNAYGHPWPTPDQTLDGYALSQDGRYLAGVVDGLGGAAGGTVFDLTEDLVTPRVAPTLFPTGLVRWASASFSPDGTRLVTVDFVDLANADSGTRFGMIDPRVGMSIDAAGLPTELAGDPEWSPDGMHIAYITNGWRLGPAGSSTGDIALLPRIGADAFGEPTVVHRGVDLAGAAEGGEADGAVSWSPDGRWLVFQHGTGTSLWSPDDDDFTSGTEAALYLLPVEGGAPVRLDRAVGGPDATGSYLPVFSPFVGRSPDGGTRYWIAFTSTRVYGNVVDPHRNSWDIWVTAIDGDAPPGTDPSHVAYWLPGQSVVGGGFDARWAPLPCRAASETCSASGECCAGFCRPAPDDPSTARCEAPPPDRCRAQDQTCDVTTDCCVQSPELVCRVGICRVRLD